VPNHFFISLPVCFCTSPLFYFHISACNYRFAYEIQCKETDKETEIFLIEGLWPWFASLLRQRPGKYTLTSLPFCPFLPSGWRKLQMMFPFSFHCIFK
jgi:hypothetical protein